MIRYLTWRNIFGVLLLAILVMIWPLEWIGWYSLHTYPNGTPVSKINAITGHVCVWVPSHKPTLEDLEEEVLGKQPSKTMIPGHWKRLGW